MGGGVLLRSLVASPRSLEIGRLERDEMRFLDSDLFKGLIFIIWLSAFTYLGCLFAGV